MKCFCLISTFLLVFLSVCACSSPSMMNTPDPCAGATEAEARQKFTYEQIVPCLNSVEKVSAFMHNNIKYDRNFDDKVCGENCYYPASLVYQNGIDDCDGHAILQCSFLEQNGLNALMVALSVESPVGHNICVTGENNSLLVLDSEGQIIGPFQSLEGITQFYIEKGWMVEGGSLRKLKASQVAQTTTDHTSPDVLGLPWIFINYQ